MHVIKKTQSNPLYFTWTVLIKTCILRKYTKYKSYLYHSFQLHNLILLGLEVYFITRHCLPKIQPTCLIIWPTSLTSKPDIANTTAQPARKLCGVSPSPIPMQDSANTHTTYHIQQNRTQTESKYMHPP